MSTLIIPTIKFDNFNSIEKKNLGAVILYKIKTKHRNIKRCVFGKITIDRLHLLFQNNIER